MTPQKALAPAGFAAAACVACCAPPIIAALGVTAGLEVAAGIFLGPAAAIAVVLAGGAWMAARARRRKARPDTTRPAEPVPVAAPTARQTT